VTFADSNSLDFQSTLSPVDGNEAASRLDFSANEENSVQEEFSASLSSPMESPQTVTRKVSSSSSLFD
jgi:hypothetical protein